MIQDNLKESQNILRRISERIPWKNLEIVLRRTKSKNYLRFLKGVLEETCKRIREGIPRILEQSAKITEGVPGGISEKFLGNILQKIVGIPERFSG